MTGADAAPDGLPPLRDVIATHGLSARKALGQNFLLDLNLTRRIARSAGQLEGTAVIEVGPGPGGLTRALLMEGASSVTVIERDQRCLPALQQIAAAYPGRVKIIEGDALSLDWNAILDQPARIVANLPYNIATPLLTGWVATEHWPPAYQSLTLMFQREVAQRICAMPGDKAYGRLSVLCQWRTQPEKLFDISPRAFTPPPKVTSSVVHLKPLDEPMPCRLSSLEAVTRAAFGQRRKMLRSSLSALGGESLLNKAGVKPTARAEELDLAAFVRLANAV